MNVTLSAHWLVAMLVSSLNFTPTLLSVSWYPNLQRSVRSKLEKNELKWYLPELVRVIDPLGDEDWSEVEVVRNSGDELRGLQGGGEAGTDPLTELLGGAKRAEERGWREDWSGVEGGDGQPGRAPPAQEGVVGQA